MAIPKVVISYRRSDSSAIAGRIFDRLVAQYGADSVFMDIENIPFGIDFRKYIQSTLTRADVLVVVIGPQWIGAEQTGAARIAEASDPVRVEVEMAFERAMPVIPVLIDGARMPMSAELPESLRDFAFLNAAEVATGRDFHIHMERLIKAIDQTAIPGRPDAQAPYVTSVNAGMAGEPSGRGDVAEAPETPGAMSWPGCLLQYFVAPVVVLLVAHHLIVNSLNLDTGYLRAVSFAVPFIFGFFLSWRDRCDLRTAIALGVAVGLVAVTGMTVSASLNSGDPIVPTTTYEWRENVEYAVTISLCFIAAHRLARTLRPLFMDKGVSGISR